MRLTKSLYCSALKYRKVVSVKILAALNKDCDVWHRRRWTVVDTAIDVDVTRNSIHRDSEKKEATYIFAITSAKVDRFPHFFTVKFRKDLQKKLTLKLPPPLKSVATLPCEM